MKTKIRKILKINNNLNLQHLCLQVFTKTDHLLPDIDNLISLHIPSVNIDQTESNIIPNPNVDIQHYFKSQSWNKVRCNLIPGRRLSGYPLFPGPPAFVKKSEICHMIPNWKLTLSTNPIQFSNLGGKIELRRIFVSSSCVWTTVGQISCCPDHI